MKYARLLGLHSAIYGVTNVLQRGASLLLLPLYTRYMAPDDYGVLAVVTALNGFLSVLFTWALPAAITRFYFDYRDEPQRLKRFWGTILIFVGLLSLVGTLLFLALGEFLLRPVTAGVAFWPYVALGVGAVAFQPLLTTFLSVLQTRGEAMRYAGYALANFALTLSIAIALVVFAGWGALGPLTATFVAAVVFAALALYKLRGEVIVTLDLCDLRTALRYALPQVPHMVGAQVIATTDRLLLNRLTGAASAGLYSVGSMFGMAIDLVAYSVNRAYVPIAMHILSKGDDAERAQLRELGLLTVAAFFLFGSCVGLFGRELVMVFTASMFHQAYVVVPFIALSGAVIGVYYVLVNVLFFDVNAARYLPIGTLSAAIVSVGFNLALIPRYGLVGAAAANLAAQISTTCVVGLVGHRFERIRWPYWRLLSAFVACAVLVLTTAYLQVVDPWISLATRLTTAISLLVLISLILWHSPLHFFRALLSFARLRSFWQLGANRSG